MRESASPILECTLERGVLVLTVTGPSIQGEEVAEALRKEMLAAVDRAKPKGIVIDLSRARYVSSIAFWPLLSLRRRQQEQGGRLIICGLTGAVADVFHTTKMVSSSGAPDAPFEVADNRDEAVNRLAPA
jgi:anti-anti-sigma factor